MRFVVLALVLSLATATAAWSADDPVIAAATDLTGEVMFLESGAPGMVLVVVRGDGTFIRGYGETEKGNGIRPDGASLVRLNSITKVFTTEVLASLVAERKLALTDSLQRFAPGMQVPAFAQRPITLLDLATYSGALPREIGQAPEGANPRAWPTHDDRWAWLRGYTLPWAPGTVTSYSNVGFDLLADAVGTAGGAPYAHLLNSHVTMPLGMTDTGLSPTPDQCARLMIGSGLGGPATCVDTQATGGSGGLYSTGNDMARWLRHNLSAASGVLALSHAVYRQRQSMPAAIGFDEASPMAGLALGWVSVAAKDSEPALLVKSGGGAGFMSYVAFAPGRDVGVFVVVNRIDFAMFATLTGVTHKLIAGLATR
ncbi:D-alanyl-D-alanine-carboxypeptidase/endopeptidase AmpH [Methylobacterium sp. 77]|uniref:D-alanyl-D-alanine- carboxypeptidase/endopeptidase AmpH n=1 Tax=Methylobacterium sp. 77 TaxID=1101192 RepID=UPI000365B207|nr:D-alanyl-D-alanine-carboxypeptidase/endopeptidase AmpH [Methylobacterium sp. 77]